MSFEDDLKDTTSGAVGETRTLYTAYRKLLNILYYNVFLKSSQLRLSVSMGQIVGQKSFLLRFFTVHQVAAKWPQ